LERPGRTPYLESVDYDLTVLADWLPRALGDDGVIILGDHQPPALIGALQRVA
jgi:hypothetical protein